MSKWDYLEDEYAEEEAFQPIRKTKGMEENMHEFNALCKKDNDRKSWARARKLKEFEEITDNITET